MRYVQLDKLGAFEEDNYLFSGGFPENIEDPSVVQLDHVGDFAGQYPADPYSVRMQLDEDMPKHIKMSGYVSTTHDFVMVSMEVQAFLETQSIGEVDFWPFTLVNHRGRVHSRDYRFVVPRSFCDVIHETSSAYRRGSTGAVIGIDRMVLDARKIEGVPAMFRINDLCEMAFAEPLAEQLQARFTNFVFSPLEVL